MSAERAAAASLRLADLRGCGQLAVDATLGVTATVAAMHRAIGSGPMLAALPGSRLVAGLAELVYGTVAVTTRLVGGALDLTLASCERHGAPPAGPSSTQRDAALAALNGVLGDHLEATANPLAQALELRVAGRPLALDRPLAGQLREMTPHLLVLVHGVCLDERHWSREDGHDHGAALAARLGATAVYVRYNSGLHVSRSGRALAAALDDLVRAWPGELAEVTVIGHSMGGLVARSACHHAELAGYSWRRRLRRLVFLGTPHHGAPLERAGSVFERLLGAFRHAAPLARLGRLRSAGITDLRHGNVRDEDWTGRDRFARGADPRLPLPLPVGVECFALAAEQPAPARRGWRRLLPSDGLVPVASAHGRHPDPARDLALPPERRAIVAGGHFDLLARAAYGQLESWLVEPATLAEG